MAKTLSKSDAVIKALKSRKRGITAAEVAEKTGVSIGTVRAYIQALKQNGQVGIADTVRTGGVGRPANKYVLL